MRAIILSLSVGLLLVLSCPGLAQLCLAEELKQPSIILKGRENITITKTELSFGDVAEINSAALTDDDAIIALRAIPLGKAPSPGAKLQISAESLLDSLRNAGVDLQKVGYIFPKSMTVRRAARPLTQQEVNSAIQQAMSQSGRELLLRRIDYRDNIFVPPGPVSLSTRLLDTNEAGLMRFIISAKASDVPEQSFQVNAEVDEWREFPVAARPLAKGNIIREDDLKMARMSLRMVPSDSERSASNIVGREISRPLNYGELFQRNKLNIPPVVSKNSKVVIQYKTAWIEATATGIALESGAAGDDIKVRNDSSKKLLNATIIETGLVGVR